MEYNDYELLYMVKENEEALEFMLKKYEPIFRKIARSFILKFKNKGLDYEDIVQHCRIVFCKALDRYNPDNEVLFFTYFMICLKRSVYNYINRNLCRYENANYMDLEGYDNLDLLVSSYDAFDNYSDYEMEQNIINFKNSLKYEDGRIFELRYNGFSYKDIASLLEIDVKRVDNALLKIRKKLEKYFLFS